MGTPEFPASPLRWDPLPGGHFSPGRPSGPPLWGVVHATDNTASNESEDAYAHTRVDASAHAYVDNDDPGIQTVLTTDRAWSAFQVGNELGVHVELTGKGSWSREQWLGQARESIRAAAAFLGDCASKYGWDLVKLTTEQVATRRLTGFCGHVEITDAFGQGDHRDPGPGFPWDVLLSDVHTHLGTAPTSTSSANGDSDMPQVNGELPAGFGIDEHDGWISAAKAVAVPLPAVGAAPGQWGPAWLYLAASGTATIRYGCFGPAMAPSWRDAPLALTEPAGPLPLPAGTTLLIVARKRTAADDMAVPARWHVQYGPKG